MKEYQPSPLDTTSIELPASLVVLMERLAENTHEVWAETRIKQGWVWGPERNDVEKQHPCLVPYASLPESEKEFDRNAARETLKMIMELGYRIEPPESAEASRTA